MTRAQQLWIENLAIQVATAAALVAVYFLAAPAMRGSDPRAAVVFLPSGQYDQAAFFVAVVLVLAAACALVTLPSRMEGALAAVLLGAGGISARSPQFRTLLWARSDGPAGLYLGLMAEVVVLTGLLLTVYGVVVGVRRVVGMAWPGWTWKSLPLEPAEDTASPCAKTSPAKGRSDLPRSFGATGLTVALGMVVMLVLLQSADRGQALFSVLAGSLLGSMAANRFSHPERSLFIWLAPMVMGILFYMLGLASSTGASGGNWTNAPLYAQVLPIDWLTAGCGGAALGCWFSQRSAEASRIDWSATA